MPTNVNVTGNLIERNFVHSISLTSTDTTSQIWGIVMRGQGSATIQNNMIQLGLDKDGNSITNDYPLSVSETSQVPQPATTTIVFYIGGSGWQQGIEHVRLLSNVVTTTRNHRTTSSECRH
jgi:hypothetical protein